LSSTPRTARALEPGQELRDHEVKEAALLLVVSGEARIEAGGDAIRAVAGDLCRFDPEERHAVSSEGGARLLLTLAPWPGEGHYRGEERAASSAS
jgi:quercetin dioxygenase-like cupin family protein